MTTTPRHPLVEAYLEELERRSAHLPPGDRHELLGEIRNHVDLGAVAAASEADIRNMLDSLGSPDDIVSESERDTVPTPTVVDTGPTGRLALGFGIAALVLLPTFFVFCVPLGVAAIVLGVRARNSLRSQGVSASTATAGAVTGGVALIVVALLFTLLVSGRSYPDGQGPRVVPSPTTVFAD